MSTQQKKTELLTFGYVNKSYHLSVPIALLRLIQLYYDKYYYLSLKGDKLQKFLTAQIGERLYYNTFKIKGIEFQFMALPNGIHADTKGLVVIALKIKHLPKDIEYFDFYREMKCDDDSFKYFVDKQQRRINKRSPRTAAVCCKLSELNKMDCVYFNCFIDIKYIKYKKQYKKKDYIASINKLHKMSTFKWDIDESMMAIFKTMKFEPFQCVSSDTFDDNNWSLRLCPNGLSNDFNGWTGFMLQCSSISFNKKKIVVKFTLMIDEKVYDHPIKCKFGFVDDCKKNLGFGKIMQFNQFIKKKSISFQVKLEILKVYDENSKEIDKTEWDKYNIID